MDKTITFLAKDTDKNLRLDKFLSNRLSELTRSQVKKVIVSKGVKINKKVVISASEKIKGGNQVEILISENKINHIKPKKIKIDVVFEDKEIIVINKPSGLTVHPGAGNKENTLVNGLIYLYKKNLSNLNGSFRPGIIHRIDKETSGLLVIAKNNFSHAKLSEQFRNHSIKRKYIALVWGVVRPLKGKISTLLSRNKRNRQLMSVSKISGKKAITNYKTLKTFESKDTPNLSLIECELETGRTHQIRVHMNYLGNSIVGDDKYKKKFKKIKNINPSLEKNLINLSRQFLHAKTIGFVHPKKNTKMIFHSNLPDELEIILKMLRNAGK